MVTGALNKLRKATMIVDISVIRFNTHCIRPMRWQRAIHSLFAFETRCEFALNSLRFSQSRHNLYYFFMRGLCAVYV